MSRSFASRPTVKTSGRGSNNRQTQSDSSGVHGRSTQTNNTTQSRGRARGAGPQGPGLPFPTSSRLPASTSTSSTSRGRGAVSSISRGRRSDSLTNTSSTRMQSNRMTMNTGLGSAGSSSSPPTQGQEDTAAPGSQQGQYVGGFTKFEPNSKKRMQVSEMARKETEQYEKYKQQNAVKYCNYVGTTGGGETTEDMVRRRQANDVRSQKFNRLQNQQKRREEMREAEQRDIDQKRAEARRKADENVDRYKNARPDDIRRKREEFLRQLETQPKAPTTLPPPAASVAKISTNNSSQPSSSSKYSSTPKMTTQSSQPRQRQQQQQPPQNRTTLASTNPTPLHPRDPNPPGLPDSAVQSTTHEWNPRRNNNEHDNYEPGDDKKFEVEDFPEEVMTLSAMFPEMDMTVLNGLYKDTGSIDAVLDIIGV